MRNRIYPDETEIQRVPLRALRTLFWFTVVTYVIGIPAMWFGIYIIEPAASHWSGSDQVIQWAIWIVRAQAVLFVFTIWLVYIGFRRLRTISRIIREKRAGQHLENERPALQVKFWSLKGAPMPPKRARFVIGMSILDFVAAGIFIYLAATTWESDATFLSLSYLAMFAAISFIVAGGPMLYMGAYWLRHQDEVEVDA